MELGREAPEERTPLSRFGHMYRRGQDSPLGGALAPVAHPVAEADTLRQLVTRSFQQCQVKKDQPAAALLVRVDELVAFFLPRLTLLRVEDDQIRLLPLLFRGEVHGRDRRDPGDRRQQGVDETIHDPAVLVAPSSMVLVDAPDPDDVEVPRWLSFDDRPDDARYIRRSAHRWLLPRVLTMSQLTRQEGQNHDGQPARKRTDRKHLVSRV